MRELNIQERKEISLRILQEIDRVCHKHSISYYLAYGTLIGAVRHKGFIPWDDDIDIWVKWEEYQSLMEVIGNETSYEVINRTTDSNFPLLFTKVSAPDTLVVTKRKGKGDFKRGISVDIFPLVPFPESSFERNKFLLVLYINKFFLKSKVYGQSKNTIKEAMMSFCCSALSYVGLNEQYWKGKMDHVLEGFQSSTKIFSPFSPYKLKDVHRADDFREGVRLQFEEQYYKAPNGWDSILKRIYGNYMELPPKEKRVSNHDVKAFSL